MTQSENHDPASRGESALQRVVGRLEPERAAMERMRARFEAQYGDLSDVMRAALAWRSKWADWQRPHNAQMEQPVMESDVDEAECRLLRAVQEYARSKTPNQKLTGDRPQGWASG